MKDTAFKFNGAKFAAEEFADEIVVLDVIDGTYFALGGAVPKVWKPLSSGVAVTHIVDALAAHHAVSPVEVASALGELSARLQGEGILEATVPTGSPMTEFEGPAGEALPAFIVDKHEDMQDLLTLDPIHDVDQTAGWPHR